MKPKPNQLPEGWEDWNDAQRREAIFHKFNVVKEIKRRCQDASNEDVARVAELVFMYKWYFPNANDMKVSACKIPHIVSKVAKYLHGVGLLDSPYVI